MTLKSMVPQCCHTEGQGDRQTLWQADRQGEGPWLVGEGDLPKTAIFFLHVLTRDKSLSASNKGLWAPCMGDHLLLDWFDKFRAKRGRVYTTVSQSATLLSSDQS